MLKFQRIRTKPELIRIFLNSSLWATKEATVAHSNQKTRTNIKRHFGQKYPELLPENWKLNGNIFFKLCVSYLDVKMTSAGYKRERNKKHSETCEEPMIYSYRGVHHVQVEKAYLWIILALEASILSQVTLSLYLQMSRLLSPKDLAPSWANKHFADGDLEKTLLSGVGDWPKELKDVLQLANDEIIPLSKFGANRK